MARQNLIERFAQRPPPLEGGLSLAVEMLGDRRARLLVSDGAERRFEGRAAGLSVPYPSGLKRLLGTDDDIDVVLVERASRGLAREAAEQNVGYLDLRGRGRLVAPGFVYVVPPYAAPLGGVDVEEGEGASAAGAEPARPAARVSPFAPKASRVARALLAEPARAWRVSDLANQCEMNPGNVHRVLGALSAEGLVEKHGDGHVVVDPGSLLEAWADRARHSSGTERLLVPVREDLHGDVTRVVEALDGRAAVSGELAAELYAPHLPATRALVHCIDRSAWERARIGELAGPPPLRRRGDIVVDLADAGVADFGTVRDGLPLVAPQQLYVDLYRDRTRAREAAEHVRREVLSY